MDITLKIRSLSDSKVMAWKAWWFSICPRTSSQLDL